MELAKTIVLRLLQTFIVVGAIVIGLGVAVWLYPPLFPWGLAQLDRSPFCAQDEAFRASQRRYDLIHTIGTVQSGLRLIETDIAGFELWQTGSGPFWVPEGQIGTLAVAIASGRVDMYGGASFGVRDRDVVLDCRAGSGAYVREALQAGAAKVVALEYDPRQRESLRRNFKDAIEQGTLVIHPEDPAKRAEGSEPLQQVILGEPSSEAETIASAKIDELIEGLKLERVDVIKMTTEGAALRVLDSARKTIRKHRPRLAVSTEEVEDDENKITEWLTALNLGYKPECQVCGVDTELVIRPDIVLFQAPAL